MIDRTATVPLMFQPGTNWSYSSSVDIQGYIVEKLSGQTFGEFMAANIFRPLKMVDTGFFTGPEKASRLSPVYAFDRAQNKIVEAKELFGVADARLHQAARDGIRRRRSRLHHDGLCPLQPDDRQWRRA